jgi:PAS domain S-box-containing protein
MDIKERNQAVEVLRASEEKYRFLFDKSPTLNIIIGNDGLIKDLNAGMIEQYGYAKDEIIGKPALDFVIPQQKGEVARILEKDFKGEYTPEINISIRAKDGSIHNVLFMPGSVLFYEKNQTPSILVTGIDVTESKKAEQALRESEEKFRNLAEQSPNMIFINKKGRVVYANQRCEEIMGYSRNEFYSPDFDFLSLIAPECVDLVKSSFNMHLKDEEITPYEYTLITREGEKIDAILTTKLITYEGENAILGTVTDITESKKIEQKIIQANKELSALNSIASMANQSLNLEVILKEAIDKVLEVTDCRAGGIYILNQLNEELELKAVKGLSREAVKEIDKLKLGEGFSGRIALNGEPIMVEDITQDPRLTRLIMKKEGVHSYLGVPLKSKGKILGTLFVITQKNRKYNLEEVELLLSIGNQIGIAVENAYLFKEAEQWIIQLEAIRNITNRLNKLNDVKTVASSVMEEIRKVIDFDNCRVFVLSENREELIPIAFGSEVKEYEGETEEVLRLKIGEGITGWVAQTGEPQVIEDGERHPRSRHIPGSPYVDESMIVSPMIYEGEVRGVITLSKLGLKHFNQNHLTLLNILANEAVVAIENAKLFQSLKQAYAKLKEAQEQLIQSEKLRALGEMAGGVAHDFNNLLGAILGRAQLLLLSTQENETKKGLSVIEKAALDGAETVRRIQEFTRLRTDENFQMLDLNEILMESLEITKHKWKDEAQKKGILIQVETNLNQNLAPVSGNPSELREVFVNMILNSVDAMTKGGTLKISSHINENYVLAAVTDTGIGMSEAVKRKVFDPFFTTKGPKGNGLGMSLAYGIIVRHSGKILIESQEGEGATFTVRLPKRKSDELKIIKEKKSEENQPENILIIDDEPAIRDLLCDLIQSKGHQTVVVDNCLKGLEIFKKGNFGIVFTDLSMPEMSGWGVVEQLKALEPEVVVVMVTGWGTQVDNKKLKVHAVDLLMAKPFEVKKFFEILNQALKIKQDRGGKRVEKISSH